MALFDAFAIPSAMIVSSCLFGRRYTRVHIVAVMACVIGIALNVIQDYAEDERVATEDASQESEQEQYLAAEYPYKVAGDALAIVGGVLFGISNTLQEVTVKDGSLLEYLGCFTFFASIIASVQAMFFERGEIAAFYGQSSDETCSRSEGELLFFIFAIGGMVTYAGVGAFLQFSDAAFFNLRWAESYPVDTFVMHAFIDLPVVDRHSSLITSLFIVFLPIAVCLREMLGR